MNKNKLLPMIIRLSYDNCGTSNLIKSGV